MPRALKGRMPRTLPDHRSTLAKRLRVAYDDLTAKYQPQDGVARRIALLAARAWIDYEEAAKATARKRRGKGTEVNRLRRRQTTCAGQFLAGLRQLELLAGNGAGRDLARMIQEAQRGARDDG